MVRKLSRRGMILILILPLLSLMAILGIAFVALAHCDMQVAMSYVDSVRARSLAISGVEFATAQLSAQARRRAYDSPVWGAATWDQALADNQWVYRTGTGAGTGVAAGEPLINPVTGVPTPYPSFKGGVTAYGHTYSLTVPGTYRFEGDYCVIKVIDCQSKLNLNSPHVPGGNPNFAATLQILLDEVRARPGSKVPAGLTGTAIVNLRNTLPGDVFAAVSDISALAGSPEALMELADFVGVSGWLDLDAVEPIPNAPFPPGDQNTPLNPRTRRTDPTYRGRYPVNMNVASRPVLVAALTGIGGFRLRPSSSGQTVLGEPSVVFQKEAIAAITLPQAQTLAVAIILEREAVGPFSNWSQFETFLNGKLGNPTQEKLVFVNANPNLRCAKFNPDLGAAVRYGGAYTTALSNPDFVIDKLDLNPGTTEFCFSSMGYFDVESVGRVMSGTVTQIMGESKVLATIRVYDVLRHTTQRDFSLGQMAPQASPSVNTYPEPLWDNPAATSAQIAQGGSRVDGCLELSTEWEASPPPGATWYINNRRGMNLVMPPVAFRSPNDVAATGPLPGQPWKQEAYGGAALPAGAPYGADNTYATNTASLWAGSDLANDGILSWSRTAAASPAYGEHLVYDPTLVLGTLPDGDDDDDDDSGTIEFWVKPASTHGSNEVYLAIVSPTTAAPEHREGLVWRLERYGTTLYSIRFYYHKVPSMTDVRAADRCPYPDDDTHDGDPIGNCIGYTYYQQSMDISAWRAGEWHKISHVFPHPSGAVNQHGLVTHNTLVDGVAMGSDINWPRDKAHANPSVTQVTQTITTPDFDPGFSGSGVTYTATVNQSSNNSNLMNLVSLTAAPRMFVGGYLYTSANETLRQINAALTTNSNRFSNTTIDEIRYYRNNTAPGTSPNRFSAGGGTFDGKFSGMPAGTRLGTLSYTAYYPRAWNGNASHVPASGAGASSVILEYATSTNAPWIPDGGSTAGEGGPLYPLVADAPKRSMVGGEDVYYRLKFTPGGTPTVLSPIVDDVTLTVIRPKILSWAVGMN